MRIAAEAVGLILAAAYCYAFPSTRRLFFSVDGWRTLRDGVSGWGQDVHAQSRDKRRGNCIGVRCDLRGSAAPAEVMLSGNPTYLELSETAIGRYPNCLCR